MESQAIRTTQAVQTIRAIQTTQTVQEIQEIAERAQRRISEGEQCVTVEFGKVDDPETLVKMGFLPFELGPYRPHIEDNILYKIPHNLIEFLHPGTTFNMKDLQLEKRWKFCSIEYYKQQAQRDADSLPLMLYAPELVYSISKRPKTDMSIFRDPKALSINKEELQSFGMSYRSTKLEGWQMLPVTRYATGMHRGLYHKESDTKYCGTFYYLEPESSTYLSYQTSLVARSRTQAVNLLEKQLGYPISPLFVVSKDFEIIHPLMAPEQVERSHADVLAYQKHGNMDERKLKMIELKSRIRNIWDERDKLGTITEDDRIKRSQLEEEILLLAKEKEELFGPFGYRWDKILDYFPGAKFRKTPYTSIDNFNYLLKQGTYPEDLMMTPNEAFRKFPHQWPLKMDADEVARLPQTPRYMGNISGLYANEDFLDQYVCQLGKEAGYDIILLTHNAGSHQVVSEVLDTRDRNVSFQNLIYVII